jgi:hypothetical protein
MSANGQAISTCSVLPSELQVYYNTFNIRFHPETEKKKRTELPARHFFTDPQ